MFTKDYKLNIKDEKILCSVDYAEGNPLPSVISIHGGGDSDKETTGYISEFLTKMGKSVVRFSHPGHGESSGSIKDSSLKRRFQETCSVISHFEMSEPLTVIGSSMGGYIASKITEKFNVDKLILFCPAAYTYKAWDIPFSKGFTRIIREENSFKNTDIQEILSNFNGEAILFLGNKDEIIPPDVISIYRRSLKKLKYVSIEDCPHPIHKWVVKMHKENLILTELSEFI